MDKYDEAVAIVGLGAILPDALDVKSFWNNLLHKRYSITEVTPDRWNPVDYYDPDPKVPDKTYSKIGGWVRGFEFDWKRFRIPPKVAAAMDQSQCWAISVTQQALTDYGYPKHPLPPERTAVVLGTAMGGEMHYLTYQRISFPYFSRALQSVNEFDHLEPAVREMILEHWHQNVDATLPPVTEDSMPGELANIVAGRVANVFNFRGPNFTIDAACASSIAAVEAAVGLLQKRKVDAAITGGVDYNMTASAFTKFSKIGALSATGSRPFGEGADGFVMGEGAVAFLLKRLEDAERDGDRIYAVIRGIGGSSDGKGKGITAPNPIGQVLAMQRAWDNAGLDPATATLVEAHGTSTRVGDVVEVESLSQVFQDADREVIALGSVKGNIGHLKAASGGAGLLKTTLALCNRLLPPTVNAERPNPEINFKKSPFYLNQEVREWNGRNGSPRCCGVSSYGFGGTNYHLVLEEHIPERNKFRNPMHVGLKLPLREKANLADPSVPINQWAPRMQVPLRGILAIGAATNDDLKKKFGSLLSKIQADMTPPAELPSQAELANPERLVIDFGSQEELIDRMLKAQKAFAADQVQVWLALQSQGIFRGRGPKLGKLAFLFPGQGSQYLNMGKDLVDRVPIVAEVFQEADRVMTPILGKPLSAAIFVSARDEQAQKQAEKDLMQTAITQPAMLTMDIAIYRLLIAYGFKPDMVMGHSLGEYAGLIASGAMAFADALEAVAARGREMSSISMEDNGWMAAVMAPYELVEKTLQEVGDYVVIANINSYNQCVIGGASRAVETAIGIFQQKGYQAQRLPVSHAFHTKIVTPASSPLRKVLDRLTISPPDIPLVSNVTGQFYPNEPTCMKDLLEKQVASPVQWIKGLEMLYAQGARTFVEVGPKKALKGFVDDVLGGKTDAISLFTNHPKVGELASFNQALCGLYASGFGVSSIDEASSRYTR